MKSLKPFIVPDDAYSGSWDASVQVPTKNALYDKIETLLSASTAASTYQPLDATLTAFAALTITANSLSIGNATDAFSQTTFAANTFPARASTGNLIARTITDFGLSLVDDADASAGRTTLGLGTLATQSGTFSGTSSGTNTGDQTSVTGNAGTATALQTARTIGGVSFDGTANITVASATGGFTVSGGNIALSTNSLTLTGSIGATGARVTKGWFTDIESTNMITINGTSLSSTFQPLDSDLTTIAGLTATTDNFIIGVASAWASRTPAQAKTSLSLNNVENTALSTWAGTSNITTLGTISTGTWSGTSIGTTKGGTGLSAYTTGDILYASATNTLAALADVATGNALISGGIGVAPSWGKVALTTHVSGNLPVTNLNSGTSASSSTFWRGDGTWAATSVSGAALTKTDDTNVTLSLGGSPTTALVNASSITVGWTGILASSRGGTANGFFTVSGPASSTKTFTFPNSSETMLYAGGPLGTPVSGTLTSCTGLPVSGITASTSTALGVGSIELGNASDTTIARVSAGVISVEGVTVPTISSTSTFTNKTMIATTNVVEEITTTTSSSTPTPTGGSLRNFFTVTALAAAATFEAPSGTAVNGNRILIRIKDNGGAQTLEFNAIYRAIGVTLPTTTVASKTLYIGCVYNSADTKWDIIAYGVEA